MQELTVSELFFHPLKSARSVQVEELLLDHRGPLLDRHWVLVDERGKFLSQRTLPQMCFLSASISSEHKLQLSFKSGEVFTVEPKSYQHLDVRIWNDEVSAADCGNEVAYWLQAQLGKPCRLAYMPHTTQRQVSLDYAELGTTVGFADGFPLLVVSKSSIDALGEKLGRTVSVRRFRPNIVLSGTVPHAEDGWREIKIRDITNFAGQALFAMCDSFT